MFYIAVSRLPLHFSLPYVRQMETLNVAQSKNGGLTFVKDDSNPILLEPPSGFEVTGRHDPAIAP